MALFETLMGGDRREHSNPRSSASEPLNPPTTVDGGSEHTSQTSLPAVGPVQPSEGGNGETATAPQPTLATTDLAQRRCLVLQQLKKVEVVDLTPTTLAQRRRAVLIAMETATPIDLSGDEAESTGQKSRGITRKRRRSDTTESSLPSPKRREMLFRITSLKCEMNKEIRSYTLDRDAGSWRDSEDHAVWKGRVNLDSVVDVLVQPDIGYLFWFTLTRNGSCFVGRYATGTIKISEEEMEATLTLEDPSVRALVRSIFL